MSAGQSNLTYLHHITVISICLTGIHINFENCLNHFRNKLNLFNLEKNIVRNYLRVAV